MKGIIVEKPGAPMQLYSELEIPEPSDDQILVRSIYTAVNPVDNYMASYGTLVVDWPLVPGCDAGGIIVKVGKNAMNPLGVRFKEGDEVCGCTRLGSKGYSPWQEYFLMDAKVTIPKPKNISLAQAATLGVGSKTALLGIFNGLKVPFPDLEDLPVPTDDWVLVLGGASSVGKFAVQILKACGLRVVATCSASSSDLLKSIGADETVEYTKPPFKQISEIQSITGGKLGRVMDAVAMNNDFATKVLDATASSTQGKRYYTTTNDWDPLPEPSHGFTSNSILLGPIGRPDAVELNKEIEAYIPIIYKLVESGKVSPSEYEEKGVGGFEGLKEAWEYQMSGKAGNRKVIVKIGEV